MQVVNITNALRDSRDHRVNPLPPTQTTWATREVIFLSPVSWKPYTKHITRLAWPSRLPLSPVFWKSHTKHIASLAWPSPESLIQYTLRDSRHYLLGIKRDWLDCRNRRSRRAFSFLRSDWRRITTQIRVVTDLVNASHVLLMLGYEFSRDKSNQSQKLRGSR